MISFDPNPLITCLEVRIAAFLSGKITRTPEPGAPAPKTLKILFSTPSLVTKFVSNLEKTGVFKNEILIPNKKNILWKEAFFSYF